jgi:excisionase family DNA binding protein
MTEHFAENDAHTLNVREAARRLDVHENTIRNWVADGLLTDARVPGSSFIRLRLAEVESMTAHRHSAEVEAAMVAAREAVENLRVTVARAEAFLSSCVIPPGTSDLDLDQYLDQYDAQPGIETTVIPPASTQRMDDGRPQG